MCPIHAKYVRAWDRTPYFRSDSWTTGRTRTQRQPVNSGWLALRRDEEPALIWLGMEERYETTLYSDEEVIEMIMRGEGLRVGSYFQTAVSDRDRLVTRLAADARCRARMQFAQESGGVAFIWLQKKTRDVRAIQHTDGTLETHIREVITTADVMHFGDLGSAVRTARGMMEGTGTSGSGPSSPLTNSASSDSTQGSAGAKRKAEQGPRTYRFALPGLVDSQDEASGQIVLEDAQGRQLNPSFAANLSLAVQSGDRRRQSDILALHRGERGEEFVAFDIDSTPLSQWDAGDQRVIALGRVWNCVSDLMKRDPALLRNILTSFMESPLDIRIEIAQLPIVDQRLRLTSLHQDYRPNPRLQIRDSWQDWRSSDWSWNERWSWDHGWGGSGGTWTSGSGPASYDSSPEQGRVKALCPPLPRNKDN